MRTINPLTQKIGREGRREKGVFGKERRQKEKQKEKLERERERHDTKRRTKPKQKKGA